MAESMPINKNVILLACGSFNPPTVMHIRMFELAQKFLQNQLQCKVLEGIISPAADSFGKKELVSAKHRLRMLELATEEFDWIRVDSYECLLPHWSKTLNILKYHRSKLLEAKRLDNEGRLMLLCGGDMIDSFTRLLDNGQPLWLPEHVHQIIRDFGIVAIQRLGATTCETLRKLHLSPDELANVFIVNDFKKEELFHQSKMSFSSNKTYDSKDANYELLLSEKNIKCSRINKATFTGNNFFEESKPIGTVFSEIKGQMVRKVPNVLAEQ
uniref:Cytidyltransferase-like domain-containing protein n=1 Tax=Ditylenchus dipsaci TaxID=166011 RepID=A0A915ES07_9BILA